MLPILEDRRPTKLYFTLFMDYSFCNACTYLFTPFLFSYFEIRNLGLIRNMLDTFDPSGFPELQHLFLAKIFNKLKFIMQIKNKSYKTFVPLLS